MSLQQAKLVTPISHLYNSTIILLGKWSSLKCKFCSLTLNPFQFQNSLLHLVSLIRYKLHGTNRVVLPRMVSSVRKWEVISIPETYWLLALLPVFLFETINSNFLSSKPVVLPYVLRLTEVRNNHSWATV